MDFPEYAWQIKGRLPGPTTVVMGGTHGDELAGVRMVQSLLKSTGLLHLPWGSLISCDWVKGSLYLVLGNPEAILRNTRSVSGVRDLNRWFIKEDLAKAGQDSIDRRRARELAPLLAKTDLLIDLHATSNPSTPFLCASEASRVHRELAPLFLVENFLTDPRNILGQDMNLSATGTTDYCVNSHGGTGICYESGKFDDLTGLSDMERTVVRVLERFGSIFPHAPFLRDETPFEEREVSFYALTTSVSASEDRFTYEEGMDRSWQQVKKDRLVGRFPSGEEMRVPTDGMYVFPRRAELVKKDLNLFYLAGKL